MSKELDRRATVSHGTAVASLVAVAACALAGDALGARMPADPSIAKGELSARVAAAAERIRLGAPAIRRELPPKQIAQWPNRR